MGTAVIIPALNEAEHIFALVSETLQQPVDWVFVVDNGSSDGTASRARKAGAQVIVEPRRGYGFACLAGARAAQQAGAHVLVFMDGDYSSLPAEMDRLVQPIQSAQADLVLGSRSLGKIARGAMPFHQHFGNWLSARVMRALYGVEVTDLGPYRAIGSGLLASLDMREGTFGWPTEMTVKVARRGGRILEVPVSWEKRRSGRSKISGTLRGTVLAAYHIFAVLIRYSAQADP